MKPNFALTLSYEGIGLLHRAFPGWHLVGEIALDDTDLLGALGALRDKAIALDPSGLRTKLVIPNDQIRYIRADAPDTAEDLPDLVKAKLDGATPYPLDDLVYDWSQNDDSLLIAAVARDTLSEAEAFAKEHRFNPISFVAIPENGDFAGEPFFGETSFAAEIAPDGGAVERDPAPVRVIGTAKIPEPEPVPEPTEPQNAPHTAPKIGLNKEAETEAEAKSGTAAEMEPEAESEAEPETAEENTLVPGFSDPPIAFDAPERGDGDDEQDPPRDISTFSSIRAHRSHMPSSAPRLDGVARQFQPMPVSAAVVADSLPADPDGDLAVTEPPPAPPEEPEAEAHVRIPPAPLDIIRASAPNETGFSTRRAAPDIPVAAPRYVQPPLEEEERRMTVFGARDAKPIGGKPRYLALILTVVLLLFLVGIAAWASVFLDDGLARFFRDDRDIIVADVPAVPEAEPEMAEEAAVVASLSRTQDDIEFALGETLSQPKPAELTDDEARARYAATGIWQMAPQIQQPPAPSNLDDFYQTSIDGDVTIQDAIALPDPGAQLADMRPQTPNSPARAGTTFALDDRGLVVATARGALTPDGITVYAGAPPVVPTVFPKRERVEDVLPPEDPVVRRLAGFRPKSRPGDLSEQNERGNLSGRTRLELAALRPKLRPQSAQEAAEVAARRARAAEQNTAEPFIDLDAVNSAVTEAVSTNTEFDDVTPQAVASSLKPNGRPRHFDRIVKRSTQEPQSTVAVSASQRVAPRIPTATSVAKQATQRNAIHMRRINLIGVYGTPNSRRALVRLSNGRYRKVKVGDRLDGGKVSAIGDTELRYQKSGRSVVLKMPRG